MNDNIIMNLEYDGASAYVMNSPSIHSVHYQ